MAVDQQYSGPPRLLGALLWIVAIFLSLFLFLSDLRQLDGLRLTEAGLVIGRDFLNVWSGGSLALTGQLDRLYDYQAYMDWQTSVFGPLKQYNYSYPPDSLFLAMPFALLPYPWALAAWTLAGAGFFLWAARPYMPSSLPAILSVLTPAAMINIWVGHYGFVIGGLWLLFFHQLRHAPMRSGMMAGLLTLKPHLGLMIVLTLLHRRAWRTILVAGVTTLLLVGLSGTIFGFDLWRTWIFETSALQARIMTAAGPKFYFFMMPSAYIALRDGPALFALLAQATGAGLALMLAWRARDCTPHQLAFVCASATALIMPYIFNYDLTVCSLGFAILLYRRWSMFGRPERIILWSAFAAPLLVMVWNPIAPVALMAGMLVQVRHYSGRSYRQLLLPAAIRQSGVGRAMLPS